MNDSMALGLPSCDLGTCSCAANATNASGVVLPLCDTTACACVLPFDTPTFATVSATFGIAFLVHTVRACACLKRLKFRPERFDAVAATDKILGGIVVKEKAKTSKIISVLLKVAAVLFLAIGPATLLGLWGGTTAVMNRKQGGPTTL